MPDNTPLHPQNPVTNEDPNDRSNWTVEQARAVDWNSDRPENFDERPLNKPQVEDTVAPASPIADQPGVEMNEGHEA